MSNKNIIINLKKEVISDFIGYSTTLSDTHRLISHMRNIAISLNAESTMYLLSIKNYSDLITKGKTLLLFLTIGKRSSTIGNVLDLKEKNIVSIIKTEEENFLKYLQTDCILNFSDFENRNLLPGMTANIQEFEFTSTLIDNISIEYTGEKENGDDVLFVYNPRNIIPGDVKLISRVPTELTIPLNTLIPVPVNSEQKTIVQSSNLPSTLKSLCTMMNMNIRHLEPYNTLSLTSTIRIASSNRDTILSDRGALSHNRLDKELVDSLHSTPIKTLIDKVVIDSDVDYSEVTYYYYRTHFVPMATDLKIGPDCLQVDANKLTKLLPPYTTFSDHGYVLAYATRKKDEPFSDGLDSILGRFSEEEKEESTICINDNLYALLIEISYSSIRLIKEGAFPDYMFTAFVTSFDVNSERHILEKIVSSKLPAGHGSMYLHPEDESLMYTYDGADYMWRKLFSDVLKNGSISLIMLYNISPVSPSPMRGTVINISKEEVLTEWNNRGYNEIIRGLKQRYNAINMFYIPSVATAPPVYRMYTENDRRGVKIYR